MDTSGAEGRRGREGRDEGGPRPRKDFLLEERGRTVHVFNGKRPPRRKRSQVKSRGFSQRGSFQRSRGHPEPLPRRPLPTLPGAKEGTSQEKCPHPHLYVQWPRQWGHSQKGLGRAMQILVTFGHQYSKPFQSGAGPFLRCGNRRGRLPLSPRLGRWDVAM